MKTRLVHHGWVAGGLAAALVLLCVVTAGDAVAVRRVTRSDPDALKLLRDAAKAAAATPYEGTQFIMNWGRTATSASLVDVAHTPGRGTFMRVHRTTADPGALTFEPDTEVARGGLVGYTAAMLNLLVRNFSVVEGRPGEACGRSARVVEARRSDGSVAGRFWIDLRTGLMLGRELLDQRGRTVTRTGFSALRFGPPHVTATPGLQPAAAVPWPRRLVDADLGTLRERGWTAPPRLPGNLALFEARESGGRSPVLHLGYSDGLSVVSVFIQRGELDEAAVRGWHKISSRGRTIFVRDTVQQRAVWASRGYVYTVLADAPQGTMDAAVAVLPHGGPGVWLRLRWGFGRLMSWLNPFG